MDLNSVDKFGIYVAALELGRKRISFFVLKNFRDRTYFVEAGK
jgi:hypothetical protein